MGIGHAPRHAREPDGRRAARRFVPAARAVLRHRQRRLLPRRPAGSRLRWARRNEPVLLAVPSPNLEQLSAGRCPAEAGQVHRQDMAEAGRNPVGFQNSAHDSSGDRQSLVVGHDRRRVAAAAVPDLAAGARPGPVAGAQRVIQGHRVAGAASRGCRAPPHQPTTTIGLDSRPDPAAVHEAAEPSPGHAGHCPALAPPARTK